MAKNLRKKIYTRSTFRNKFIKKKPTKENKKLYRKQRNKYVALRRKCIEYFHNTIDNNIVTNKIV